MKSYASQAIAGASDTHLVRIFKKDPLAFQIPRLRRSIICLTIRYVANHNKRPGGTYRIAQPAPDFNELIKRFAGAFKIALLYGNKSYIQQSGAYGIEMP